MKYIIFILIVAVCGCREVDRNTDEQNKFDATVKSIDTTSKKLDVSIDRLRRKIAFLDSNLKYGHLAKEMEIKMYESEANYYRTQDEKYYKQFFKYRKKQWTYVGLCNRYNDSLISN